MIDGVHILWRVRKPALLNQMQHHLTKLEPRETSGNFATPSAFSTPTRERFPHRHAFRPCFLRNARSKYRTSSALRCLHQPRPASSSAAGTNAGTDARTPNKKRQRESGSTRDPRYDCTVVVVIGVYQDTSNSRCPHQRGPAPFPSRTRAHGKGY